MGHLIKSNISRRNISPALDTPDVKLIKDIVISWKNCIRYIIKVENSCIWILTNVETPIVNLDEDNDCGTDLLEWNGIKLSKFCESQILIHIINFIHKNLKKSFSYLYILCILLATVKTRFYWNEWRSNSFICIVFVRYKLYYSKKLSASVLWTQSSLLKYLYHFWTIYIFLLCSLKHYSNINISSDKMADDLIGYKIK